MITVGQIVRKHREGLGLTLDELAAKVGVTKGYISLIENEKTINPPSEQVLSELERALKVTDGEVRRAAEWQNTPARVRGQIERAIDSARRVSDLAGWLKEAGARAKGGGKNLDKLFKTGELARRVDAALGEEIKGTGKPRGAGKHKVTPADDIDSLVPARYQVPLINRISAGYPRDFTDLGYPARVADDYVSCPDLADPDAFAARVIGDSMLPDYREGDVVVFSPAQTVVDGSDCFVRIEPDHESTFKRVFFDKDQPGTVRLQPLNPAFAPRIVRRDEVAGMYKAVWRMQAV